MTNKAYVLTGVMFAIIIYSAGAFTGYKYNDKPVSKPISSPVVAPVIVRPIGMTLEQALGHLKHFDTDEVVINWKELDQKSDKLDVSIKGSLYQRHFSQTAELPISEQGNFKFYAGLTLGTVATAGALYGGYRIYKWLH